MDAVYNEFTVNGVSFDHILNTLYMNAVYSEFTVKGDGPYAHGKPPPTPGKPPRTPPPQGSLTRASYQ